MPGPVRGARVAGLGEHQHIRLQQKHEAPGRAPLPETHAHFYPQTSIFLKTNMTVKYCGPWRSNNDVYDIYQ